MVHRAKVIDSSAPSSLSPTALALTALSTVDSQPERLDRRTEHKVPANSTSVSDKHKPTALTFRNASFTRPLSFDF